MPRPLTPEEVELIDSALDGLPSLAQTVGKLEFQVRRTKPGSKLNIALWNAREEVLNEIGQRTTAAKMALYHANKEN